MTLEFSNEGTQTAVEVTDQTTSPLPHSKESITVSAKQVSLPKMDILKEEWLDAENSLVLESLRKMLASESEFTDSQFRALKAVRSSMSAVDGLASENNMKEDDSRTLLVYCLACHLAHESVLMGIDPTSLLKTFAFYTALSLKDSDDKMSFLMPHTPKFIYTDLRKLKSRSSALIPQVRECWMSCRSY